MPLQPYKRNSYWYAKGHVEYLGRRITESYRCSTGSTEEAGAWEWCRQEEERQVRIHLIGVEASLTFSDAVLAYKAQPNDAKYLVKIVERIGPILLKDISPRFVRDLGPEIYPDASTKTWTRQIITPIRAVINNLNDDDSGRLFHVRGYTKAEAVKQDQHRGSNGRQKWEAGSWEWLLRFRQHADRRHAALALLMFVTAARITQATKMHPTKHFDPKKFHVCIPEAKGHAARWLRLPALVVDELMALPRLHPKGYKRIDENLRLFGFASRSGPRKGWAKACDAAGIPHLPFHSAGRHGYGQEITVRQGVDEKAAAAFGGWDDIVLMRKTYTHVENVAEKLDKAFHDGLAKAEGKTGLRLRKDD